MPKIEHLSKEEILSNCQSTEGIPGHNYMGCSESWYDPFYCLKTVFGEELNNMSEQELNNLYRLASEIGSALY